MSSEEKVLEIIFAGIDKINARRLEPIDKDRDIVFIGENGVLDSLDFVNFIVIIENEVEKNLGVKISLTNEEALSQSEHPVTSVNSLLKYVLSKME